MQSKLKIKALFDTGPFSRMVNAFARTEDSLVIEQYNQFQSKLMFSEPENSMQKMISYAFFWQPSKEEMLKASKAATGYLQGKNYQRRARAT